MSLKSEIYNRLPEPIKPVAKGCYQLALYQTNDRMLHSKFIGDFFDSQEEYEEYVDEFESGPASKLRNEGLKKYQKLTGSNDLSGIGLRASRDYYALIRKLKPETIVETGVCNGMSTLAVLLAIQENKTGFLYSIDYPLRADESLEEFREETFRDYGGAAIPSDKEPGWIIPDELKSQWELIIGKSQRELPKILTELDSLDLFLHDSEHSHPCMMFEYELAYEWLSDNGIILSDDITWNDAFSVFTSVRKPKYGRLAVNIGYMKKNKETKTQ